MITILENIFILLRLKIHSAVNESFAKLLIQLYCINNSANNYIVIQTLST